MDVPELTQMPASVLQLVIFAVVNIILGFLLFQNLGNYPQTMAATIFIGLVVGTLVFWQFRVAIAFLGIVILLATGTVDLDSAIRYMSLDVILFLIGMMVIVGLLKRSGFFRWLLSIGLEFTGFEPIRLFLMVLVLSAMLSATVNEVTSMLFTAALILDFCAFFKIPPVKLMISAVLATNIGSSWTVLGNPVGILIALRSGLTFTDFLYVAFPVGVMALFSIILVTGIWHIQEFREFKVRIKEYTQEDRRRFIRDLEKIEDKKLFFASAAIFFLAVPLLANHHRLELLFGVKPNTMLVGTALFGAGVALLWKRDQAREILSADVDWWTLTFFMLLFAKAGALKYTGLTKVVADALYQFSGAGNIFNLILLVLWISAITSAAADNVVVVATFIPVLQILTAQTHSELLWWALLFGGCYGGNLTMVGSTANIIALGMLEERSGIKMTLRYWLRIGFWGTLIPVAIASVSLLLMHYSRSSTS